MRAEIWESIDLSLECISRMIRQIFAAESVPRKAAQTYLRAQRKHQPRSRLPTTERRSLRLSGALLPPNTWGCEHIGRARERPDAWVDRLARLFPGPMKRNPRC